MSRTNVSMLNTDKIGSKIRDLRIQSGLPLRKLAALIDLDQSTLSKIERNVRYPNSHIIGKICSVFRENKEELLIAYYSDIVCNEIQEAKGLHNEILKVSENKLKRFNSTNKNEE